MRPFVSRQRKRGQAVVVPPSGGTATYVLPATITRRDGASGAVAVSYALPTIFGVNYGVGGALILLRYAGGGAEIPISVVASDKKWPGTTQPETYTGHAVLNVASTDRIAVEFVVGLTPTTARLAAYLYAYASADKTKPAMHHKCFARLSGQTSRTYLRDTDVLHSPVLLEEENAAALAAYPDLAQAIYFYRPERSLAGSNYGTFGHHAAVHAANGNPGYDYSTYEHVSALWAGYVRAADDATSEAYFNDAFDCILKQLVDNDQAPIGSAHPAFSVIWHGYDPSLPTTADVNAYGLLLAEWNSSIQMGCVISSGMLGWRMPILYLAYRNNCTVTTLAEAEDFYNPPPPGNPPTVRDNCGRRYMPVIAAYLVAATQQVGGAFGAGRNNALYSWHDQLRWIEDALENFAYSGYGNGFIDGFIGIRQTVIDGGAAGEFPLFQFFQLFKAWIVKYRRINASSTMRARTLARFRTIGTKLLAQSGTHSGLDQDWMPYVAQQPPATLQSNEWYFYPPMLAQFWAFLYAIETNPADKAVWRTKALRACRQLQLSDTPSGGGQYPDTKRLGEYHAAHLQEALFYLAGGDPLNLPAGAHPTGDADALPTFASTGGLA